MTLINIGELVKSISNDLRGRYSNIPWKAVAGLRDIVAHRYQTLRMEDIWITITQDVKSLKNELKEINNE